MTFSAAVLLALFSTCWARPHGILQNLFNNHNLGNSSITVGTKDCQGPLCSIDMSAFDIVGDTMNSISFDLHGGARSIKCNMDELGSDLENDSWAGNCDGNGWVNLLQRGTNSRGDKLLYGSITDMQTDEICRFVPDADGNNQVDCIPIEDFPVEAEPNMPTPEEDESTDPFEPDYSLAVTERYGLKGSAPRQDSNNETRRFLQNDNGGVLDIMIVYTRGAECLNSRLSQSCSTTSTTGRNMRNQLAAAIAETNSAFSRSGIQTRLRLVHSYRENYNERNGNPGLDHALAAVRNSNDRIMDRVHDRRNQYGADLVALIIGMEDAQGMCGKAWSGPRRDLMFSVTDVRCLTGNLGFGHEVGHNLGLSHDRGTKNECSSPEYAYGYRDPQGRFRTIMAYNCRAGAGQCDNVRVQNCRRIPYFSSRSVRYNSMRVGDSRHDCARKVNEERRSIAGYFPAREVASSSWQRITYDDFESGYGSFMIFPGSDDATRITNSRYITGSAGIRLRDNRNRYSSVYHQRFHDVNQYSRLRVLFSYCTNSMEGSEDFFVDMLQSGGRWTSVARYMHGRDFANGSGNCPRRETVEIDASALTNIKIRFRCDASNDQDWVYIDDVTFEGRA